MSADPSGDELSALASFRAGDSGPLKQLSSEELQRVMRLMTREELMLLGTQRQRTCPHASTETRGSVRGERATQSLVHCLDCGLVFERPGTS